MNIGRLCCFLHENSAFFEARGKCTVTAVALRQGLKVGSGDVRVQEVGSRIQAKVSTGVEKGLYDAFILFGFQAARAIDQHAAGEDLIGGCLDEFELTVDKSREIGFFECPTAFGVV